MTKRLTLKERRAKDSKGKDALFESIAPVEQTATEEKLAKVTLYIRPEQIVAIEAIQFAERRLKGKRPDKSTLVQEALDLLIDKYKPEF